MSRIEARRRAVAALLAVAAPIAALPTAAAELRVGPNERFATLEEAGRAARPGERVLLAAGSVHRACAVWRVPGVAIVGEGAGAVLEGPVCQGKALLVIAAEGVAVENLVFRNARAADGNGAGIRQEAGGLAVRGSRFEGNEAGILTAAELPGGTLLVEGGVFAGNGHLPPGGECAHAICAGRIERLVVRGSRFASARACHHIKSRARETVVEGGELGGGERDRAAYLLDLPDGGALRLAGVRLRKGINSGNWRAAVAIGMESRANPPGRVELVGNTYSSLLPLPSLFVWNRGAAPATLSGNRLRGAVWPLLGPGLEQEMEPGMERSAERPPVAASP